jgi:hypothetical protein
VPSHISASRRTGKLDHALALGADLRTLNEHFRVASRGCISCSSAFRFDARWNPDRNTVEFGIGVGEYEGVVRVSRRVFQILLLEALTPERCLEAYHLHRTRFELIAERKVRRRHLTDDGNVEITGRDLREREIRARHARPIGYRRAAL